MFKTMVLCFVAVGLAISLAACGKSVEAKCKEMVKSVPGYDKEDQKMYVGDEAYEAYLKQCIGTMKAQ